MGFILVIIWVIATIIFYLKDSSLFFISLILSILHFWSLGILYNFKDVFYTPSIWAIINFITTIAGIIFLIISILS